MGWLLRHLWWLLAADGCSLRVIATHADGYDA
jgi:hypothetical protein